MERSIESQDVAFSLIQISGGNIRKAIETANLLRLPAHLDEGDEGVSKLDDVILCLRDLREQQIEAGDPLAPGVILIEALAQLSGIALIPAERPEPVRAYLLGEVRRVRFRRKVRPGERVELRSRLLQRFAGAASFAVEAWWAGSWRPAEGELVVQWDVLRVRLIDPRTGGTSQCTPVHVLPLVKPPRIDQSTSTTEGCPAECARRRSPGRRGRSTGIRVHSAARAPTRIPWGNPSARRRDFTC